MVKNKNNRLQNSHFKAHGCIILVLAMVLYGGILASASVYDDLIVYWNMELDGRDIKDLQSGKFHMHTSGSCGTDGKIGAGFEGNGINCSAQHNASFQELDFGTGDNSISFWVKRKTNVTANIFLMDFGNVEQTGLGAYGNVIIIGVPPAVPVSNAVSGWGNFFSTNDTILTYGDAADSLNTWTHYVQVRKDGRVNLYKNGVLQSHETGYSQNMTPKGTIRFLVRGAQYLNASIDEVGIWNRALSLAEVGDLYNSGAGLGYDGNFLVTLESPADNSGVSQAVTFNASIAVYAYGYNLANATLYIWNSTGIFNSSMNLVSGNTTNITSFDVSNFVGGDYNWNIEVCADNVTGSLCKSGTNRTFSWRPFEITSQSYNIETYETKNESIFINITTLPSVLSVSSKLNYNGTLFNSTSSCISGECVIRADIDVPFLTGSYTNRTFYWEIDVYDGARVSSYTTTSNYGSQNTTRIMMGECNTTLTIKTLNFTAWDEIVMTRINPFYFKGTFNYWIGSGIIYKTFSINLPETSNASICLFPDIDYYSSATIEYNFKNDSTELPNRNYYLDNSILNNNTLEIALQLINIDDLTPFIIKVQDQSLSPVADAYVYIQRYYAGEGIYKTVQIAKTDVNGESVGYYEILATDYKHIIIKEGEVLLETSGQKIAPKEAPYTLTFTVGDRMEFPWQSWSNNTNLIISLSYNKTSDKIILSYIDISGETSLGRLIVKQENTTINAPTLIICNTSIALSSATLECDMTGQEGIFIAEGEIDGESVIIILVDITDIIDMMGNEGLILGFFLILVGTMAFLWNATAGIIGINLSLIMTKLLGFIAFPPITLFAVGAISLIALIILRD